MNIDKIHKKLCELEKYLISHGVRYASIVSEYREQLESLMEQKGDVEYDALLAKMKSNLFRGMGSLNDVWISKNNNHIVTNEKASNRELDLLRKQLKSML